MIQHRQHELNKQIEIARKNMSERTYRIFRSYHPSQDKPSETIKEGLTLAEAQEHCQDPDSEEKGVWFDGYTAE